MPRRRTRSEPATLKGVSLGTHALPPPRRYRRRLTRRRLSAFRCRVRLAATCRTLRAASAHWFRNDVVPLGLAGLCQPEPAVAWVCRVEGEPVVASWPCGAALPISRLLLNGVAAIQRIEHAMACRMAHQWSLVGCRTPRLI